MPHNKPESSAVRPGENANISARSTEAKKTILKADFF